jgi:hypothetical protein
MHIGHFATIICQEKCFELVSVSPYLFEFKDVKPKHDRGKTVKE